jgi:hypothetical protein
MGQRLLTLLIFPIVGLVSTSVLFLKSPEKASATDVAYAKSQEYRHLQSVSASAQLNNESAQLNSESEQELFEAKQIQFQAEQKDFERQQYVAEQEGNAAAAERYRLDALKARDSATQMRESAEKARGTAVGQLRNAERAKNRALEYGDTAAGFEECFNQNLIHFGQEACLRERSAQISYQKSEAAKSEAISAKIDGRHDDAMYYDEQAKLFWEAARKADFESFGYLVRDTGIAIVAIVTTLIILLPVAFFVYQKYDRQLKLVILVLQKLLGEEELKGLLAELEELKGSEQHKWILSLRGFFILVVYAMSGTKIALGNWRSNSLPKRRRK